MKKRPISLIIDAPAPGIHVLHYHFNPPVTDDGRPLLREIPNSFFKSFVDIVEKTGIKGKFSIVPMPGGQGNIVDGIEGMPRAELDAWLDTARTRLSKYFDFCPEILTHASAVDLETCALMEENEKYWAAKQNRTTLTPYIARAVSLLQQAGAAPTGVTSPWDSGVEVEEEYAAAISEALYQVLGVKECWYFLHGRRNTANARPWIAYENEDRRVVHIPATLNDYFWTSINTTDPSEEFVNSLADQILTADGKRGALIWQLENNSWPVLISHWQSLFSTDCVPACGRLS